jgi:hypothetical protein
VGREIYRISRASGNINGELGGIQIQAMCYFSLGEFKHSTELLDEGKKLVIRANVQGGQIETMLMNIEAGVYHCKTEYSDARHIEEAILHRTSAILPPVEHAYALMNIASLNIVTYADADVVSRDLNAATTLFRSAHPRGISHCEYYLAELQHREGDVTGARLEYMRLAAAHDSDDDLVCLCLAKLADLTSPTHADVESVRWTVIFLAFALRPSVRSSLTVHQALQSLGNMFLGQGADNEALNILQLALEGFTRMDVHRSRAECMRLMGDGYLRRENICRAREV